MPPPLIERLRPLAAVGRRRDLEWLASRIAAQVAAAPRGVAREVEDGMLAKAESVLDWIVNARPNYLGMAFDQAQGESEAWHEKKAKGAGGAVKLSRNVVYDFGDGWVWVKIPLNEYKREGTIMGFSLSESYKEFEAYSLRGPANRPHVTMTVRPPDATHRGWRLKELKGKANARPPAKDYSQRVVTWLLTRPFGKLGAYTNMATIDLGMILAAVAKSRERRYELARRIWSRRALNAWAVWEEKNADQDVRAWWVERLPPVQADASLPDLLEAMGKAKSMFMVTSIADAIDARIGGLLTTPAGHKELAALASPSFQANLQRRGRSKRRRDRALAAALLPLHKLDIMVGEPDAGIRQVVASRLAAGINAGEQGLEEVQANIADPQRVLAEADMIALAARLLSPTEFDTWVSRQVDNDTEKAARWLYEYPETIPGVLKDAPLVVRLDGLLGPHWPRLAAPPRTAARADRGSRRGRQLTQAAANEGTNSRGRGSDVAKNMHQVAAFARSVVTALDTASKGMFGGVAFASAWATSPWQALHNVEKALGLKSETPAKVFGTPRFKANLERRARSPRFRERLLAAMFLPPERTVLLAGDPNRTIEILAAMRVAPEAADRFYAAAATPTARAATLIAMPKAAFLRRQAAGFKTSEELFLGLDRSVELGVPYDLAPFFGDVDSIQYALQVVKDRAQVLALGEAFGLQWWGHADHDDDEDCEGPMCESFNSVEDVMAPAAMRTLARYTPALAYFLGIYSCDDYIDAPENLRSRTDNAVVEDAEFLLDGDFYSCGQGATGETDAAGWAEATYLLARIAGRRPDAAAAVAWEAVRALFAGRRLGEAREALPQLEELWQMFNERTAA